MRKAILIAAALFVSGLWSGIGFAQTANPTGDYRLQKIEKMKAMEKAVKNRSHGFRASGTVDKSLKPRATVVVPQK